MISADLSPVHAMSSGLCEDTAGDATALIQRMAAGDRRALEEIFALWSPVLLGISHRMLGDPRDAGTAVRDTFVRIWQRAADYNPHQSPPFVWAFTILRELCIARLRHGRRARRPSPRSPSGPPQPEPSEDPRVMAIDDWRRLRAAMDLLPPDERACLESAVFLGYARTRNPEPPDTPSAAVKGCLRRAVDKLRNQLSRYEL